MKLFAATLAGSTLGSVNPFPRVKNGMFCDTSSVKGASCQDIFDKNPLAADGIYKIKIGNQAATAVECKFADGVGWTVIQKRTSGKLDFNRNWQDYRRGFSTFSLGACARHCKGKDDCGASASTMGPRPSCDLEEYWAGLDNIHELTQNGARLRIDLQRYNGVYGTVEYDDFIVGGASSNYELTSVGKFKNDGQQDIGDSFVGAGFGNQGFSPQDKEDTNHIGWGFTTKDRDNDGYEYGNCGQEDGSGWWFNRCSAVNLNGKHYGTDSGSLNYSNANQGYDDGILWQTWTNNKYESLIGTRMMVAPRIDQSKKIEFTGTDCHDIAEQLYTIGSLSSDSKGALDDIYKIMPDGITVPKYTECKFEVCGSKPIGWTMVQKRYDGSVDFNQNWNAYRSGFGCVAETASAAPFGSGKAAPSCTKSAPKPSWIGECYLGNEYIHSLTGALGGGSLLIEMSRKYDRDPNDAIVAYEHFSVGDESSNYRLSKISGYHPLKGSAGDAFHGSDFGSEGFDHDLQIQDTNHEGMAFSTKDRDNDLYDLESCAQQDRSGWWFNRCSAVNLNGHYYKSGLVDKNANGLVEYDDGVLWNTWTHTKWESLVKTKMFVGRSGAVDQCHDHTHDHDDEEDDSSDNGSKGSSSSGSSSDAGHVTSDMTETDYDYPDSDFSRSDGSDSY